MLCTALRKEAAGCEFLERQGVEAWFPVETVWRRKPGRRRERITVEKLLAPGYVFAHFPAQPRWDLLFWADPGRSFFRGRVSVSGEPARLCEEVIAQMALVPQRLRDEQTRQERERKARGAAEAEARRVWPGVTAEVMAGTFAGQLVDAEDVDAGLARVLVPLFGGMEAQIEAARLRRVEVPRAAE